MSTINSLKTISRKKRFTNEIDRSGNDDDRVEDCSCSNKCTKIDFLG
jgi:hypothetical protein